MLNKRYHHKTTLHNLTAPEEIVPVIMDLLNPKSVIDVGCGIGTFTGTFKMYGCEVLGVDGAWTDKQLLFQNIEEQEFFETELEKPISINRKFDLAVCLEVAEHLSPERAKSFVQDLTKLSDVVLFSAAIPYQGGDHHYNEQWLSYWQKHFNNEGYIVHDVIKPLIWNNEKVFWWYKQNMVLITKKDFQLPEKVLQLKANILQNVIHPEFYLLRSDYTQPDSWRRFLKLFYKAIKYKILSK